MGFMHDREPPSSVRRSRLKPLLGVVPYIRRGRSRCFICAIVQSDPAYPHHVVHEDDASIAFLDKAPRLWGTVLVAPKAHQEQVTGDFDLAAYLYLQRMVYSIGEAIRRSVPCERLYILSLGSKALNRHVHWHVAPLPPGVPLMRQQLRSFSEIIAGVLAGPEEEFERLAHRIRANLVLPEA